MASLDQMDFMMHQPEGATGQAAIAGFHSLHRHHQGCPYLRVQQEQQQQQQQQQQHHQFHGSPLPPLHLDPSLRPLLRQQHHPLLPPALAPVSPAPASQAHALHHPSSMHPASSVSANGSHSQAQTPHSQPQAQQQPALPQPQSQPQPHHLTALQHPTLPPPQPHLYSPPPPYDPVHSVSAAWFHGSRQPQAAVPSWQQQQHQHASNANSAATGLQSRQALPTDQLFGAGPNGAGGPGVGQPPQLLPTQQTLPHLTPHGFQHAYHQHRPTSFPPIFPMSSPQFPYYAAQPGRADDGQPSRPSQPSHSNQPPPQPSHTATSVEEEGRDGGSSLTRDSAGAALPSLNPNANNQGFAAFQAAMEVAERSREASPAATTAPSATGSTAASRAPPFASSAGFSGRLNRGTGEGSPSTPGLWARLPVGSVDENLSSFLQAYRIPPPSSSEHFAMPPSIPSAPSHVARRRSHAAARPLTRQPSHDSDDELGSSGDEPEHVLRFADGRIGRLEADGRIIEDPIRMAQIIRGQVPSKRVASKQAISQLQSVDLADLAEHERTCVICYNDFGQASPEGTIESPLRLPKCQHVFGDHCIKKWFDESDSCPYCRDKVPSEPAYTQSFREIHSQYRSAQLRARATSSSMATLVDSPNLPPLSLLTSLGDFPYALPSDESILRIIQRDFRHRTRPDAAESDHAASRPLPTTRERRSPPSSEMADGRRRTRARHGSFYPSQPLNASSAGRPLSFSHSVGPSASSHQSPPRDRPVPNTQRSYYQPANLPGHPPHAVVPSDHMMPNLNMLPADFSLGGNGRMPPSMLPVGTNPAYYPGMPFNNHSTNNGSNNNAFPQQLPSLGAQFDAASFQQNSTGGAVHHHNNHNSSSSSNPGGGSAGQPQ